MKKNNVILLIPIILAFFSAHSYAQSNFQKPTESGKCYAKCLMGYQQPLNQKAEIQPDSLGRYTVSTNCSGGKASSGGHTEWKEVICEKNLNPQLISTIQSALIKNGYDQNLGKPTGEMCKYTKVNLVQYQKANSLPAGQLDSETLKHLEVDFF